MMLHGHLYLEHDRRVEQHGEAYSLKEFTTSETSATGSVLYTADSSHLISPLYGNYDNYFVEAVGGVGLGVNSN